MRSRTNLSTDLRSISYRSHLSDLSVNGALASHQLGLSRMKTKNKRAQSTLVERDPLKCDSSSLKRNNISYCKLIRGRLVSLTLFRCHQVYCTVLLHNVKYITTAVKLQLGTELCLKYSDRLIFPCMKCFCMLN